MKLCCFAFSVGLYVSQFVCLTICHVLCFCFANCFVLKNGCQFYLLMKFWNSNFKKLIITRQVKHSKHANKNKLIVDNSTEKNLLYIYSSECSNTSWFFCKKQYSILTTRSFLHFKRPLFQQNYNGPHSIITDISFG